MQTHIRPDSSVHFSNISNLSRLAIAFVQRAFCSVQYLTNCSFIIMLSNDVLAVTNTAALNIIVCSNNCALTVHSENIRNTLYHKFNAPSRTLLRIIRSFIYIYNLYFVLKWNYVSLSFFSYIQHTYVYVYSFSSIITHIRAKNQPRSPKHKRNPYTGNLSFARTV